MWPWTDYLFSLVFDFLPSKEGEVGNNSTYLKGSWGLKTVWERVWWAVPLGGGYHYSCWGLSPGQWQQHMSLLAVKWEQDLPSSKLLPQLQRSGLGTKAPWSSGPRGPWASSVGIAWEPVTQPGSWVPHQTDGIKSCVLTGSPGSLCRH